MQYMDLVGRAILNAAAAEHPDAAAWLERWSRVVRSATWRSLMDVRRHFPHADGVTLRTRVTVTVFNVRGNVYRLLTVIDYAGQSVSVIELLTHREYDKWCRRNE